jgi:hypothetical protein
LPKHSSEVRVNGPRILLVTAAAVCTGACAPVMMPIHLHSPGMALERSSGEESVPGPLHVTARAGADFIEVRILNTGVHVVLVDWSGSSFISPTGRWHALVTAEWLMAGQDRLARQTGGQTGEQRGDSWVHHLWGAGEAAAHMVPTSLHLTRQPLQRIEPGTVHLVVLYPAEHLLAGEFRTHPGTSLLCDAAPAAMLSIGLNLRWHSGTSWRVNELAGMLPVRNERRGATPHLR